MQLMSKYLRVFRLSALFAAALTAQGQAPSKPAASPDYPKEATVIETDTTKVAFENDGTSTRESSSRIRVQSDAGVQRYVPVPKLQ